MFNCENGIPFLGHYSLCGASPFPYLLTLYLDSFLGGRSSIGQGVLTNGNIHATFLPCGHKWVERFGVESRGEECY